MTSDVHTIFLVARTWSVDRCHHSTGHPQVAGGRPSDVECSCEYTE